MARRKLPLLALSFVLAACGSKDTTPDPNNPDPNNPNPNAKLASLTLALSLTDVRVGDDLALTASGRYDDATEKDLTAQVTWSSSAPTIIALVDGQPGNFQVLAEGRATLTAALGAVTGTTQVVVGPARLVSLELIPNSGEIGLGGYLNVTALGTFGDGSKETLTEDAEWSTSDRFTILPSASQAGRLVTFGEGAADVTATIDGISASGSYNVVPPKIQYIQLSAPTNRIGDDPVQFTATGYWTNDRSTNITTAVAWTSSNPAIVTVNAMGVANRVADGEVVITAASADVSAQALLRTIGASVCGSYPTDHSTGIAYDTVVAPMFWLDGFDQEGNMVDFRLEDAPCETERYQSILFVIGAGWCPYCPDFKRRIDGMQADLDAAGMRVVYVETETDSGLPANNMQAQAIINRTIPNSTNSSVRLGDASAAGAVNQPFGRAVSYLPNAFVVRTNDMHVIAAGQSHDFLAIAQNPGRMYGSN